MIPKKLHFTFATSELPKVYQDNLRCWRKMCPNWEFCFYTDEKVYAFFKEYFPQYYENLPKVPCGAMLADFFRYAVLYIYGGLYSDIDTFPLQKISEKWLEYTCVLGYEYQPSKFPASFRHPWYEQEFMCQWTLLGAPGCFLYKEALEVGFQRLQKQDYQVKSIYEVLHTTGPLLITDVAKKYLTSKEYLFLDADYFGCREDEHFSFTERSVIHHQCHGKSSWMIEIKMPHLNLKCR